MSNTIELITINNRATNQETIFAKVGFEEPLAKALFSQHYLSALTVKNQDLIDILESIYNCHVFDYEPGRQYEIASKEGNLLFYSRGPAVNDQRPDWVQIVDHKASDLVKQYYRIVLPNYINKMATMCMLACREKSVRVESVDYRPNKYLDLAIQLGLSVDVQSMSAMDFVFTFSSDISLSAIIMAYNLKLINQMRDNLYAHLSKVTTPSGRPFEEDPSILKSVGIKSVPYPFCATNGVHIRITTRAQLVAREGTIDEMSAYLDNIAASVPEVLNFPASTSQTTQVSQPTPTSHETNSTLVHHAASPFTPVEQRPPSTTQRVARGQLSG